MVPAALGAHAGMAGSFKFIEFADFRPVIYLESTTANLFLEAPEEAAAYRCILASLATTALSEEQSRRLIAGLATGLYGDRKDHDEHA